MTTSTKTAADWHQEAAELIRIMQQRLRTDYYNERVAGQLFQAMDTLEGNDPVMEKFAVWSEAVLAVLESDDNFVIELRQYIRDWEDHLEAIGLKALS